MTFDLGLLSQQLDRVPPQHRAAFAAACAERASALFASFVMQTDHAETSEFQCITTALWADIRNAEPDSSSLLKWLGRCEMLLPPEDSEEFVVDPAVAEDAIFSLMYAIRTRLSGASAEAAWAAYAIYRGTDSLTEAFPSRVRGDAAPADLKIIEKELSRQRRDLRYLRCVNGAHGADPVERLMRHARSDAESMKIAVFIRAAPK